MYGKKSVCGYKCSIHFKFGFLIFMFYIRFVIRGGNDVKQIIHNELTGKKELPSTQKCKFDLLVKPQINFLNYFRKT